MVLVASLAAVGAGPASAAFGVKKWEAGTCHAGTGECTYASPRERFDNTAAGHPAEGLTDFAFNANLLGTPEGSVRDVRVDLPEGLNVDPQATPQCKREVFEEDPSKCPAQSQVGTSTVHSLLTLTVPVYNLEPEFGHPALFAFNVNALVVNFDIFLVTDVEWAGDFHESFTISEIPDTLPLNENKLAFEGERGGSFLTIPSPCNGPTTTTLNVDSYQEPGVFHTYETTPAGPGNEVPIVDCATVPFAPSVTAAAAGPTDSAVPISVSLHLPQRLQPQNTSTVRSANVTLPAGAGLNPATAPGLAFCPDGAFPLHSKAPVTCPPAARIGTVAIEAPALPPGSLRGPVYLAAQRSRDPLSGEEYRVFFDAESARYGVEVREEGKVRADPATGQLSAEFSGLPQVAFATATLTFGPQAGHPIPALSSPPVCTTTATSSAVPWSTGVPTATPPTELQLARAPGGGPCARSMAERPFAPRVGVGPASAKAGAYTPFRLRIGRDDGEQEIKGFSLTLPPGATANIADVNYCEAGEYNRAAGRSGAEELRHASCNGGSEIGTATIEAGTGQVPLRIGGRVYLSGPYRGAPLSAVVITPAVAGPFDLGNVVVHAPLDVDPESGQIGASAAIPDVFGGAKLDVRSVLVDLNRGQFTLNGTNCDLHATTGLLSGGGADPTNPAAWSRVGVNVPFRASGCASLGFRPRLEIRLFGQTRRAKHPRLKATLIPRAGQANLALASVALPHAIFLDQSSLGTVCTRPQFAARQCPTRSRYGYARAWSPLLSHPVEGPVYLRSSDHKLPDLVADLRGQVNIVLAGRIDSFRGGIRTTFANVPDLPVSRFVLKLPGGRHGLLQASRNLCAKPVKAIIRLRGQNGRQLHRHPRIRTSCKPKHRQHKRHSRAKHRYGKQHQADRGKRGGR